MERVSFCLAFIGGASLRDAGEEKKDGPVSGTSVGRITRRIWSMLCRSGDRPPCTAKEQTRPGGRK
jgi:hypothetical protein